jgi:hypothetical protein
MNSDLYRELKKQIELARTEGKDGIQIADSAWMSADQIHHWFPDMEVSWKNNHIHIRWA